MRNIHPLSIPGIMLSIRYLLAILLLSLGVNSVAGGGRTMDYAWLLFLKVNEPPVIDTAGLDQEISWAEYSVYLDATVTDDPRDNLTYAWSKLSGPGSVTFSAPSSEDTSAAFSASGTYILQLSASDGKLASTSTVTIVLSNSAPVVNAGADKSLTYPTKNAFLNATVSDHPQDTLSYSWSKVSGPGSVTFSPSSAEDTNAAFSISGIYTVKLVVSDGDMSSSDQVKVTINNSAPTVDAGPSMQTTAPDNSVYLNATVTDSTSGALTYTWSKVSGPGTATFSNSSAVDTKVTMYTVGTYSFQLRASDGELASTDTVTVDYLPQPVDKIDVIVAVGDSITVGFGDSDCVEGNAKACSGYTPKLKYLLDTARGYSHTIYEEGTGGKTSAYGRSVIQNIIAAHPAADQYLAMYGTNDAVAVPFIPSGLSLSASHPNYPGTFKDNMGTIIYRIKQAGAIAALAKAPYAKVSEVDRNWCATGETWCIDQYNKVVDELVRERSLGVSPPDFFTWFKNHQNEIHSLFMWDLSKRDDLHPTHDGYWSIARLWRDKFIP